MKIGDKVYCVKNRYSVELSVIHTKGKKYTIKDISTNIILVESNDDYYGHGIFYIDGNPKSDYIFKDYFMTNKEMRNLKLKNLTDVESK